MQTLFFHSLHCLRSLARLGAFARAHQRFEGVLSLVFILTVALTGTPLRLLAKTHGRSQIHTPSLGATGPCVHRADEPSWHHKEHERCTHDDTSELDAETDGKTKDKLNFHDEFGFGTQGKRELRPVGAMLSARLTCLNILTFALPPPSTVLS